MMDFKAYQSQLSQLSARFNLMVCLVFGLLIANLLLSSFIWTVWKHHSIEITPFSGSPGYVKSASQVDTHYLSMMSENFINERLNVTPERVDANHKRLLSFADSSHYPELLKQLAAEAKVIKNKKISSIFYIDNIHPDPSQLTAQVTGILKRYVGFQAIKEERLVYILKFRYTDSRLSILKFYPMKEKDHA
jgi:conjugal transfer pilus assembly protein TraE